MSCTHTAVAMWMLTTSDGRRLADIRSEMDARRIVHTLGITQLRGPYSWDVVDNQGRLFVAEIRRRSGGGPMIVGRNPRNPVIGDTVLLRADNRRGVGTIVDTDAIRYKVYWRNGRGQLSWHPRGELAIPRLDFGRRWP